jgi:VWFA-related protein
MVCSRRFLACCVGLLTLVLQGAASIARQPQSAPAGDPQSPVFRTGINFVRVDVIVSDKSGRPLAGLTRNDFELTEDGKPQSIDTFKFIELTGNVSSPDDPPRSIRTDADLEVEAARDDVRMFAIFLDDYHVRRESSIRAREGLARFIETALGPSDLVGVMYPLQSTAAVQFTRDHALVASALRQFTGRKFDYTPRNQYEENYARYPTETVERIRNEVSLSALDGLLVRMGGLKEGRKALVLVSEGYTGMVPPQLRSRIAGMPDYGNPATGDPTAGADSVLEQRAAAGADMDMQLLLRRVHASANRNNVAIYTLDPRGLSSGEFGIDQNVGGDVDRSYLNSTMDTLRVLAAETDGRALVNRNDIAGAMQQLLRDSSAYYLLGYNSSATTDG